VPPANGDTASPAARTHAKPADEDIASALAATHVDGSRAVKDDVAASSARRRERSTLRILATNAHAQRARRVTRDTPAPGSAASSRAASASSAERALAPAQGRQRSNDDLRVSRAERDDARESDGPLPARRAALALAHAGSERRADADEDRENEQPVRVLYYVHVHARENQALERAELSPRAQLELEMSAAGGAKMAASVGNDLNTPSLLLISSSADGLPLLPSNRAAKAPAKACFSGDSGGNGQR
jgi:hypothetical protein